MFVCLSHGIIDSTAVNVFFMLRAQQKVGVSVVQGRPVGLQVSSALGRGARPARWYETVGAWWP